MLDRLLKRAHNILRFCVPGTSEREYVRLIRTSGLFDKAFYVRSNPRLRRLFRLAPERHYALFGEAAGLCPNPGFSPRAYLYNNPDLAREKIQPLRHYIETGQAERRVVLQQGSASVPGLPNIDAEAARPSDPAPVAVVLHLFYHDMWEEFAQLLAAQHFAFDLYVTLTGEERDTAPLQARIRAAFPDAQIWTLPNHGRDIFPFLLLLQAGVLNGYDAVCKLHSKKSPHRGDGDAWRQALTAGVLGEPGPTEARLVAFLADERAGIWVADGQHYRGEDWWGINRSRTVELLARDGLDIDGQPLDFPAGSIYWIKPGVLARLAALRIDAADFEPEQALVDGTTAHAVERAMGYLTRAAGAEIREAGELDP